MDRGVFVHGEVADRALSYLRDGTSVNIIGLRLSGRSALLEHVAEQLEAEGLSAVRLTGVGPLQDRPLAALAVAGIHAPTPPLSPGALAGAVRALQDVVTSRPSVLVVDDADDVDRETTGVVVAVRSRVPVPVVAVSRLPTGLRPAGSPLADELHPAVRLVVPPVEYGAVLRLVHEMLPGPVDRSTVARIATMSGGLPGLVTALVQVGRATGRLVLGPDGWVCPHDLWDPALVQAVEPLLAHLDRDAVDALTVIALSGTIELRRATQLMSWDAIALLESTGLIHVVTGAAAPVVAVFPPLLARFLAHERSVVRTLQAQHRMATVHGTRPAAPERSWQTGSGGDGVLPLLDRRFTEHWQVELADCRLAWAAEPAPSRAIPLLTALHAVAAAGREIDDVVRRTRPQPDDPRSTALLRVLHTIDVGLRRRDPARALAALDDHPLPPGYAGVDRAVRAHLELVTHRLPDRAQLRPSEQDGPLAREALRVVRISTGLAAGRLEAAAAEADGFAPSVPLLSLSIEVSGALAAIVGGEVVSGTGRALAHLEGAHERLDAGAVRAHAYVAAYGLLLRGRLDDAEALLAQVLALSSHEGLAVHCQDADLVLAAMVASFQGKEQHAAALANQARALRAPRGPYPWMWPDAAPALVGTSDPEKSALLWEVAEERFASGFPVAATVAAVDAMERHPDVARARRLTQDLAEHESALVRALCQYLVALGSRDPEVLAAVSGLLRTEHLELYATRAAIARAIALRARGDVHAAARQAQQAWADAEDRSSAVQGLFTSLAQDIDLTTRERDVVQRIGQGLPSSAVAAALSLSVRTVDNHVQNALRKVGVSSRQELVTAVATWAPAVAPATPRRERARSSSFDL